VAAFEVITDSPAGTLVAIAGMGEDVDEVQATATGFAEDRLGAVSAGQFGYGCEVRFNLVQLIWRQGL
jgi:hypothetical protein